MFEEERIFYHELYDKESKTLIQSLQDMNALLKHKKENLEKVKITMKWSDSIRFWYVVEYENVWKPKAIALLKKGNVDVDWRNHEDGCRTALMNAVVNGNLEMAKLLITNKADVNIRDDNVSTAIEQAVDSIDIAKLLVANGANVDNQDNYGDTALMGACRLGHQDVASFLLAEGTSHTFKTNRGDTAGDYALQNGWNWDAMIAEVNLSYFDHVFDCMVNADYSPLDEKKKGRKRKRGEEEEEKKEELPFLLRFMKKVVNSDFMMSKNVFPKLSFNPGAEAGEGIKEFDNDSDSE